MTNFLARKRDAADKLTLLDKVSKTCESLSAERSALK